MWQLRQQQDRKLRLHHHPYDGMAALLTLQTCHEALVPLCTNSVLITFLLLTSICRKFLAKRQHAHDVNGVILGKHICTLVDMA